MSSETGYSAVAPISAAPPKRAVMVSKPEADMLTPDVEDKEHGTCWALKQGMKKEFVLTNCNAWIEGPFFWKDQCCVWNALCCGSLCIWPFIALAFYVPARVKGNLDILIKQSEILEQEQNRAKQAE